jgi:endonuclease/exonuclease/phosphatase family metal-dependent hydrolase
VAQVVVKQTGPIVVLGDFNSTPQNETYYLIADRLMDVHWAVGQGFGFTLPDYSQNRTPDSPPLAQTLLRFGPVARSDHIFASNHFIPLETHVVSSSGGSDHRPVVATLAFEE